MELGTVRIIGSVIIILGCFCFLYPKLIHPVILTIFGMGPKETPKARDEFPGQHMRDRPPVPPGHHPHDARGMPDEIRHMRGGPHPGMRAAAAENARQQTKGSSGRGMMGVVLPMYAVGIVVYLIYTLLKVFNKKDKKDKDRDQRREDSPSHSELDQRTFGDDEGRVSSKDPVSGAKEIQRELASLADKAMDKNMKNDMRLLQQRLAETEAQMTKILQAMKTVQARVGTEQQMKGESVLQGETSQQNASNNSGEREGIEEEVKKEEEQEANSSDISNNSSQDTDSYEVIGKSDKESSADEASPMVETVGPKVDVGLKDLEAVDDEEEDYEGDRNEEKGGSEADSEGEEDILIEKKIDSEDETEVTVRKRITRTGDTDS